MSSTATFRLSLLSGVALAAGLTGCASLFERQASSASTYTNGRYAASTPSTSGARPAGAASVPAPNGQAPGAALAPGAPPPFATVIKDATRIDGLFTMWQREEKLWFELKPSDLGKIFFLSPKVASGIGEPAVYGGLMVGGGSGAGVPHQVEFRRIHNVVQMIARNTDYVAKSGTPEARAVAAAFSPSLVGSAPVASQPHPEAKSILIEANGIFVSDMLGIGSRLQRAYRQGYGLDVRNSSVLSVRGKPELLVIEVQNHYATANVASALPGMPPGGQAPSAPRTLPDPRSLFVKLHYSLYSLPEQPMQGRRADPRVGYFDQVVQDFGDDLARNPKLRYINRWRLEKKDPRAAVSEPVKPITYWLDRTIPEKYRAAVTAGVLEWNKAFERAGFKDAIVVQVQPEDADFDTLDADRASIRWLTNAKVRFGAIGPSHADPRSGEILDADIAVESVSSRSIRALRAQILGTAAAPTGLPNLIEAGGEGGAQHRHDASCHAGEHAAEQLAYALDVLDARGDVAPESAEAEQFVLDQLKWLTMHEVGHTLGLRHNFRASHQYTEEQVSDAEFTRTHGVSASVMDYPAINLSRSDERGGQRFQSTLGPYDYWAIEYGYKPLPAATEKADLLAIAARNATEPWLAYGTDEDQYLGVDPESLHFDLGSDPLAFARKRFDIARELLARQEARNLAPGEDYGVLRRSVGYAVRDAGTAAGVLARQIGGVRTLRDYPGSGRDPLQPVPARLQREALDLLARGVFAADSLAVSPALQRRLAPDFLERSDALGQGEAQVATDFPVMQTVLAVQRGLLNQLMSDGLAARILDSEVKADMPEQAFRLSELYGRLSREVWSELDGGDIPALRRDLQRDHLSRLSAVLLRPSSASRADARSLSRIEAQELLARINAALKARKSALSPEARAHLEDSAESLQLALSAKLMRGT